MPFARISWGTAYYDAGLITTPGSRDKVLVPRYTSCERRSQDVLASCFKHSNVEGLPCNPDDLAACRAAVSGLYTLGFARGDLNKHNFLIFRSRVVLLDLEAGGEEWVQGSKEPGVMQA